VTDLEDLEVARARLRNVIEHLRILAAPTDDQNAWLHPCGWTRAEPFEHVKHHPPCTPIDELIWSFDDMWPGWRPRLGLVMPPAAERALEDVAERLHNLDERALVDEIETLDLDDWKDVRRAATAALVALSPEKLDQ
jgi:hypothetical protein